MCSGVRVCTEQSPNAKNLTRVHYSGIISYSICINGIIGRGKVVHGEDQEGRVMLVRPGQQKARTVTRRGSRNRKFKINHFFIKICCIRERKAFMDGFCYKRSVKKNLSRESLRIKCENLELTGKSALKIVVY